PIGRQRNTRLRDPMRKSALAAGGAALAIALAGCGGSGSPTSGGDGGSTNDKELFADTKELAYESSQSTEDAQTAKFSMKMDAGQQTLKGQGEGRFAGEDSAMAMNMTIAQGMETKVRVVDGTYYIKLPERARKMMGNGKPWVKLSFDGDSKLGKMMSKSLKQRVSSSDPTKLLEML